MKELDEIVRRAERKRKEKKKKEMPIEKRSVWKTFKEGKPTGKRSEICETK